MKKQFSYANAKEIPFMVVLGSEEFQNKTFILKDMNSGNQTSHSLAKFEEVILKVIS
jgi:histidyl-tRNA synthetase